MAETNNSDGKKDDADSRKILHTYPLVRHSDMPDEIKAESVELVTTACEKFSANNEMAARMIKETMDRKFGPSWHVVVGEGYGFEITYECRTLMYMYFGGNLAACIWKCS